MSTENSVDTVQQILDSRATTTWPQRLARLLESMAEVEGDKTESEIKTRINGDCATISVWSWSYIPSVWYVRIKWSSHSFQCHTSVEAGSYLKAAEAIIGWIEDGQCTDCGSWKHTTNHDQCSAKIHAIVNNLTAEKCVICLEDGYGQLNGKLKCGHSFHPTCLIQLQAMFCPTCRCKLTPYECARFFGGDIDDYCDEMDSDNED